MARQPIVSYSEEPEEQGRDTALRPRWLHEIIGQANLVQRLKVILNASKKLGEPLSHILFDGPPGLGKTTFATILANELGTSIQMTSALALSKPSDLLPFLTNVEEGSILFIDEIHRMPRAVEELICPAMHDFRLDIVLGEGVNSRTISYKLKHFTVIGASTRSGLLSARLRELFEIREHFEFYSAGELAQIVWINARKLVTPIAKEAAIEIGRRSRGAPHIANGHFSWARKFAASEADGKISLDVARAALDIADVDAEGLDKQDRRYLETLVGLFRGGPTGVESLAATMNLPSETLSEEVEPYLLRAQFIVRTPRGRLATPRAYQYLSRIVKP